ncbi:hypothetical protein PENTCL1PPCAC_19536, partial [Pristionchus entomophagus]
MQNALFQQFRPPQSTLDRIVEEENQILGSGRDLTKVVHILIQMLVIHDIDHLSHLPLKSCEIVQHPGLRIDISLQNHTPHVVVTVAAGVVALTVHL